MSRTIYKGYIGISQENLMVFKYFTSIIVIGQFHFLLLRNQKFCLKIY